MDLYVSFRCNFSKRLVSHLVNTRDIEEMNVLDIDKYEQSSFPSFLTSVPCLIAFGEKVSTLCLYGVNDIMKYINEKNKADKPKTVTDIEQIQEQVINVDEYSNLLEREIQERERVSDLLSKQPQTFDINTPGVKN